MNTAEHGWNPNRFLSVSICVHLWLTPSFLCAQFEKRWLTAQFYSEGASFGDFNHDGKIDVVAGPFIYDGPEFTLKRAFMDVKPYEPLSHSKVFFQFAHDVNGDEWSDVVNVGVPGEAAEWFENPKGAAGDVWAKHLILKVVDNESPALMNVVGNENAELICMSAGRLGYATAQADDPTKPWTFHGVSPDLKFHKYTHGLGAGDLNGDGRVDLLEKSGWWEQPALLDGDPQWKKHPFTFSDFGGAQMLVFDIDGDGDNDVISSVHAHGFGVAWFENVKKDRGITFNRHLITSDTPDEKIRGVQFSQPHGMTAADMDGDGLTDLITGKRFWAHGPSGDPEPNAPAMLYWFKLVRDGDGKTSGAAHFEPNLIDDNSGVGVMVSAADVNGDKKPDVVIGNKKGQFLFLSK